MPSIHTFLHTMIILFADRMNDGTIKTKIRHSVSSQQLNQTNLKNGMYKLKFAWSKLRFPTLLDRVKSRAGLSGSDSGIGLTKGRASFWFDHVVSTCLPCLVF